MDHLDRRGGVQGLLLRNVEEPGVGDRQKRPEALAAVERGIAHGLDDPSLGAGNDGQQLVEAQRNRVCGSGQFDLQAVIRSSVIRRRNLLC